MLNEERIKLMTKMVVYEEREGKTTIPIGKYFRSDYISICLVRAAITVTLAYCFILAMWFLYHFNNFMEHINSMNWLKFGKYLLINYIVVLILYLLIAYFFYSAKYNRAKRSLKVYYSQLKKVCKLYEKEELKQESHENLGGNEEHDSFTGI